MYPITCMFSPTVRGTVSNFCHKGLSGSGRNVHVLFMSCFVKFTSLLILTLSWSQEVKFLSQKLKPKATNSIITMRQITLGLSISETTNYHFLYKNIIYRDIQKYYILCLKIKHWIVIL